jgi:hypothetical protein
MTHRWDTDKYHYILKRTTERCLDCGKVRQWVASDAPEQRPFEAEVCPGPKPKVKEKRVK